MTAFAFEVGRPATVVVSCGGEGHDGRHRLFRADEVALARHDDNFGDIVGIVAQRVAQAVQRDGRFAHRRVDQAAAGTIPEHQYLSPQN